jgi:hypothetical protein
MIQKQQSDQGISGLFVAEYEVERTSDAGEVMVRYTVFSDCT